VKEGGKIGRENVPAEGRKKKKKVTRLPVRERPRKGKKKKGGGALIDARKSGGKGKTRAS